MFVPEKTSHCATFAGATRRGGEAAKICFNQGNSGALCPMGSVSIPAHTGGTLCPVGSVSIPGPTLGTPAGPLPPQMVSRLPTPPQVEGALAPTENH